MSVSSSSAENGEGNGVIALQGVIFVARRKFEDFLGNGGDRVRIFLGWIWIFLWSVIYGFGYERFLGR